MSTIKPIFLLADSQLLFWRDGDELFLNRVRALLEADEDNAGRAPKAAYLGASNGDAPEFYQLFLAAMDQIDVRDCRQIPTVPAAEDLEFLAAADLILLAGGDVRRGWDAFQAAGLDRKLVEREHSCGARRSESRRHACGRACPGPWRRCFHCQAAARRGMPKPVDPTR